VLVTSAIVLTRKRCPSHRARIADLMFEVKFQTYWGDADSARIVFFPHFFRFVEQAEEELFRAAGKNRQELFEQNQVWMPRVQAYSKFFKPIRAGDAIRVRLNPQFKGEKTVRYEFEIVDDQSIEKLAEGYLVVVCVAAANFKATPIPDPIRHILVGAMSNSSDHFGRG